ncbi:hypothetical protein [Dolosigranulum pigrum]|jgi:hypothetical protein|uniref:hypothetical protein n=1 Tax=Dolosigranulum pigrum TaxID=29394 RepID=UPI001AD86CAB|nr:hypothetical protein [Dolosigranulum pigrum]QTJ42654.1 hypothetical protein FE327_01370 [Dolosigranulum pigrum]QTJ46048.1 hypothetical protein FE329_01375 [Dolosigranulum pigrum]QTJ56862.1 hypothetical protein FE335_04830 [Dolosigranulum pigrum]QTJ59564.1 hypothetical protein FE337_01375 [Dolosigranulum pigrum]
MKKIIKNIFHLGILLIVGMFLVGFSSTKADYNISRDDIIRQLSRDQESLDQFNSLSNEEQIEYIEAINDPDIFLEKSVVTKSEEFVEEPTKLRSNGKVYTLTSRYDLSMLGIKQTDYKHTLTYRTDGSSAIEIVDNSGVVVRNINPAVTTYLSDSSSFISNGNAHGKVSFSYEIGPMKGLSARIGMLNHDYVGDGGGNIVRTNWTRE